MNQQDYFSAFEQLTTELAELTRRKNANYANTGNAFANFDQIESLSAGRVSRELGILVRMSDKLSRIGNLVTGTPDLVSESIEDTLKDMAVYSLILLLCVRDKRAAGHDPPCP